MDTREKDCQETCAKGGCFADPEDALLDLSKMTPEEMKQYLDELFRTRSFGC